MIFFFLCVYVLLGDIDLQLYLWLLSKLYFTNFIRIQFFLFTLNYNLFDQFKLQSL